jgi:AraC-like DNA-binding protein
VTFAVVLDDLRHARALHYLGIQRETVQRTASLLGFSDHAAFSRAFKRWTGTTPARLRKR